MRAVSNSSPLIALEKIHQMELLRDLFSTVTVPPAVALEIAPTVELPSWIQVYPLRSMVDSRTVRSSFGPGESEAISLSLELRPDRVILDDEPARRLAQKLGLNVIGTLGLLLSAKRHGLIPGLRPQLDALVATGFFIGPELYDQVLDLAGERS